MLVDCEDAATLEILDELQMEPMSAATQRTEPDATSRLLHSLSAHVPGHSLGLMHSGSATVFGDGVKTLAFGLAQTRQLPVLVVDAAGCLDHSLPGSIDTSLADVFLGAVSPADVLDHCVAPEIYFLRKGAVPTACLAESELLLRKLVRASEARRVLCLVVAGDTTSSDVTTFARSCAANVVLHSLASSSRQQVQDAVQRLQLAGVERVACVLVA